jgi:ribonuclease Z
MRRSPISARTTAIRWSTSQDFTVFNVTADAVVARQAQVNDAPLPVHGPSKAEAQLEPTPSPPTWWAEAALDV